MSRRKSYGIAAVALALLEALWFVATYMQTVQGWIANLKASGGIGAAFAEIITNPVFFLLVAVAAMGLGVTAWRSEGDEVTPSLSPVRSPANAQTQNATQSNSQSVVIHNHPPQAPAPERPAREHRAEPTPNINFLGSRTTNIFVIEGLQHLPYFSANGPGGEVEAVIVGFRNDTRPGGERVAVPERANAHVLYYDADGNEIGSVVRACWLEREGDLVDFQLGHSLWLVVALLFGSDIVAPHYQRRPSGWMGDSITLERAEIDASHLQFIEVRLIGEWERELMRVVLRWSTDENRRPILTKQTPNIVPQRAP